MEHYRTGNIDTENFEVESSDEKIVCSHCEEKLEVGESYESSSQEVRILAGNNIIEHYHDETITCSRCGGPEDDYNDEVDETNYDPYAGCDVYEDYGDHDFYEGDF